MTITILPTLQHNPPVDGFDQRPFQSVSVHQEGHISTPVVETAQLSVSGIGLYTDSTSEANLLLVPELRPFRNAALHVVGKAFVDAIPLDDRHIRRFK